jgi:hypothetical protein
MMRIALTVLALALGAGALCAELPLIRLDRIFPLGGGAGSEVLLEINGRDLEEAKSLHFDHPGFGAEWLKDRHFKLRIGADVPPGTYEVRAVGRFGISGARLFAVSRGLTEVRETEPNDSLDKAQLVPLEAAINGSCDGNGDDFFRFKAQEGQRVTIDGQAFRLDSTLRARLTLSSADGKDLVQSKPYYHRTDPLLDFVVPASGDYVVRLHDATFSGGLPYRLVISARPHIENSFPAAVAPGTRTELQLLGRNLPGSKPPTPGPDLPLEQLTVPFTAPSDVRLWQRFAFLNHLPAPSVAARGLQFWPLPESLNPVTLALADAPVMLDREPNDSADSAQTLELPAVVCGRFDRPGDGDWYAFTAKANEAVSVDLLCERLDLPGDPFVIFFDARGKELATFDDHGINRNALAQFNRDPQGTWRAPADGRYLIFVQEGYRNGGPRYQYVLRLTKAAPDFFPVAFHETNNEPSCPTVRQGGAAFYELCLNRRDFNGPVTIEAENLPRGVTCSPVRMSPQAQFASVIFTAAADAPAWEGPIRLTATGSVDDKRLQREVRCCQRRWAIANINTSVAVRQICLAVRETAPYALRLTSDKPAAPAGGTLEARVTVLRQAADFKGKMQLSGLELPPGISFAASEVAAEKNEATVAFKVAANVPPGEYTLVLRGDAQVPYNRDAKATNRPNVRVADPSTPLTVTITPVAKK